MVFKICVDPDFRNSSESVCFSLPAIPRMSEMLTSWTQRTPNETPGQHGNTAAGITVAAMTPGQQGNTAAGITVAAMTSGQQGNTGAGVTVAAMIPEQSQPSEPTQVEIGKHVLCN
ncbi:hypothetical protein AALO_G00247540 [Alosa alosa]|uniref:Uncharacterized protein n=1 Tax=Alosa alosa TaxID=278164 RepID=A0AAV6FT56_9TELE|nr:hypothetical protein AALO_G00247540 [Alosa alosa]